MRIVFGKSLAVFPLKRLVLIVLSLFVFDSLPAQKTAPDNYKEEADAIRQAVWSWDNPEFKVRQVPAEYANASRVIIARRVDINATGKVRVALFHNPIPRLDLTEIVREAIKLNDKAAVSDYSEITFTRLVKTSGAFFNNTTKRYIGVRVIKNDGTIKEISADDILLTKDEKSNKEAKLAIPDLQVGDIIDFFIAKRQNIQQNGSGEVENYTFALFDDAPIINYSIHIEAGRQYAVEYR
ncbi:MAG TPA: DUF3857 domain-containing protein, partial [Chitinophagaceae bacterium]|nr:DUF3857 domain-containing protein [Chitinophagaceae bacterium]